MDKLTKFLACFCIATCAVVCLAIQSLNDKVSVLEEKVTQYEDRISDLEESSREVVQMLTIIEEKVEVQNNVFNAHITGELSKDWGGE